MKYRTNLPGVVCALKAQLAPAKSQPPRRPATATAPPSRIFPVVVRDSIVTWASDARSSERLRSSITTFCMPERYAVKTAEPACSRAPKGFAQSPGTAKETLVIQEQVTVGHSALPGERALIASGRESFARTLALPCSCLLSHCFARPSGSLAMSLGLAATCPCRSSRPPRAGALRRPESARPWCSLRDPEMHRTKKGNQQQALARESSQHRLQRIRRPGSAAGSARAAPSTAPPVPSLPGTPHAGSYCACRRTPQPRN